jgi:hypothetical protein
MVNEVVLFADLGTPADAATADKFELSLGVAYEGELWVNGRGLWGKK